MDNACRTCTERTIGCHCTCEKYLAYVQELRGLKQKKDKIRFQNQVGCESLTRAEYYSRNVRKSIYGYSTRH